MNFDSPDKEILKQTQILWDYLKLGQPLRKTDCLIAMGSHDLRVAEYASRLMLEGWAPLLVCSGGLGRLTEDIWLEPEARKFARIAENAGILYDQIFIEDKSSNTAENLKFSRALLEMKMVDVNSAILVHKPYMERRVMATVNVVWPELECVVSSPQIAFKDYPTPGLPIDEVINIMAGDFHRLIVYAEMGYQTPQEIPGNVLFAFIFLVEQGFEKYLLQSSGEL